MHEILTLIATGKIYNFLDANGILTFEQKGCRKGSYGCKDLLLINNMLLENSFSCHRNLNTARIDYRIMSHNHMDIKNASNV